MDSSLAKPSRSRRGLILLALLVIAAAVAAQWWHMRSQQRFGAAMAALAGPGDIHMLVSKKCEGCDIARAWLRQHRVAFSECNVEDDPRCAEALRATGSDWTPVIQVRGQVIRGFMPQLIFDRLRA